jgi:hypothetical protein
MQFFSLPQLLLFPYNALRTKRGDESNMHNFMRLQAPLQIKIVKKLYHKRNFTNETFLIFTRSKNIFHICNQRQKKGFYFFLFWLNSLPETSLLYLVEQLLKEGPLTKNGPIDFAQSWAIHVKKSN